LPTYTVRNGAPGAQVEITALEGRAYADTGRALLSRTPKRQVWQL